MHRPALLAVCLAGSLAFAPAQETEPEWVLTLADGTTLKAESPRLNAKEFQPGKEAKPVPLERLWRLERRPAGPAVEPGGAVVRLPGGGDLAASELRFKEGKLSCRWPLADRVLAFTPGSIPGWRLDGTAADIEAFEAELAKTDAETDRVLAFGENGAVRVVPCKLIAMDGKELTLEYREKSRALALAKLFGVVLKTPATADVSATPLARIACEDGSVVPVTEVGIRKGVVRAKHAGVIEFSVPLAAVRELVFRPPSLVYLSDLEPAAVREQVQLTRPFPWQPDRNTLRQSIRLGDVTHSRGLGMHAESALTYGLGDSHHRFVARVGLDAKAGRAGHCIVRVLVDGKEKFKKEFLGKSAPVDVAIDVKGARQLTLQVDPGPNFDIGDHIVWADARLLKE